MPTVISSFQANACDRCNTPAINGWTITHDGHTWWALRDGDEPYAAAAWLEAARWASANPGEADRG